MTSKYEIVKEIYMRIGDARAGIATSGTAETLTDNNLFEPDGFYDNGTLLLDTDPPVGVVVNSWNASSHTFNFSSIGSAVSPGTRYIVAGQKFPLDVVNMCIEQALHEIGSYIETMEITSTGDYFYSLSNVGDVRVVEYSDDGGDTWKKHLSWRLRGGRIEFLRFQPSEGSTIRIHYLVRHEVLTNWSSLLHEKVNGEMIVVFACRNALLWRNYRVGTDEPNTTELLNYYVRECERFKAKVKTTHRDPILPVW